MKYWFGLLALFCFVVVAARGDLYLWTDNNNVMHIANKTKPNKKKKPEVQTKKEAQVDQKQNNKNKSVKSTVDN